MLRLFAVHIEEAVFVRLAFLFIFRLLIIYLSEITICFNRVRWFASGDKRNIYSVSMFISVGNLNIKLDRWHFIPCWVVWLQVADRFIMAIPFGTIHKQTVNVEPIVSLICSYALLDLFVRLHNFIMDDQSLKRYTVTPRYFCLQCGQEILLVKEARYPEASFDYVSLAKLLCKGLHELFDVCDSGFEVINEGPHIRVAWVGVFDPLFWCFLSLEALKCVFCGFVMLAMAFDSCQSLIDVIMDPFNQNIVAANFFDEQSVEGCFPCNRQLVLVFRLFDHVWDVVPDAS